MPERLKLRVFAGPNGSGKSTVIEQVRLYKENNKSIEFGYYINSDDIGKILKSKNPFSFLDFKIKTSHTEFIRTAIESGLLSQDFTEEKFIESFTLENNFLVCKSDNYNHVDRLAQIISDFLRKELLKAKERFSFETVFSHRSKLQIMKDAKDQGYKVYLYFVSTVSPEINKFRVLARKEKGGHDVPADKIESRYYRSLDFLHEAAQISDQVFFFDNSEDGGTFKMFAHFKVQNDQKQWDEIIPENIPSWFIKYYSDKNK